MAAICSSAMGKAMRKIKLLSVTCLDLPGIDLLGIDSPWTDLLGSGEEFSRHMLCCVIDM
ncbi:MAG TPA: hypothetical protein VM639_23420 [Dongiaceae bacterium]|nr:hypothetical protein [Dongiaceae bacterium]